MGRQDNYCTAWVDVDGDGIPDGCSETSLVIFSYPHLARVANGYGGVYAFTYPEDLGYQSSVTKAGEGMTTFTYDAGGQRVKTVNPDGTILYSPFPSAPGWPGHGLEPPGRVMQSPPLSLVPGRCVRHSLRQQQPGPHVLVFGRWPR